MSFKSDKPVDNLRKLPQVQLLNPSKEDLLEAVSKCKKLILDQDQVRANVSQGRTTLILRDLPKGVSYNQIKSLMEQPELIKQLGSKVKSITPELNDTWFVRFATEEDCLRTAEWLTFEGRDIARGIMGKPVKCRVKSVLQSSTFNAGNQQMGMPANYGGMDPYAYAGFNQGFFGMPPHPQSSPQMGPFGGKQRGNKTQRRNSSNRGGSRGGRDGGRDSGRGRGTERQQSTRHSPQALPRQPSNRPKRQKSNRKQIPIDGEDVYYKGQFVLVERTSFDAVVKQARVQDMNEPVKPEALRNLDFLCQATPTLGFDLPGCGTGRTISPYPPTQPSPADPPDLNLDQKVVEKPDAPQPKKGKKSKKKNSKKKKQQQNDAKAAKAEEVQKVVKQKVSTDTDQKDPEETQI